MSGKVAIARGAAVTCPCGADPHPGRDRCPACLVAACRALLCGLCGDPVPAGWRNHCPACARRVAGTIRFAVASGALRPTDLAPKSRRGEGTALAELQRAHGTDPEPCRAPTRAQRRAARDQREADARARMRAAGLTLGREGAR